MNFPGRIRLVFVCRDVNASETMGDFFSKHPLPAGK